MFAAMGHLEHEPENPLISQRVSRDRHSKTHASRTFYCFRHNTPTASRQLKKYPSVQPLLISKENAVLADEGLWRTVLAEAIFELYTAIGQAPEKLAAQIRQYTLHRQD